MSAPVRNIVILISGAGSNLQALMRSARQEQWEQRLQARITAVISNRSDAPGLALARTAGLACEVVDHAA